MTHPGFETGFEVAGNHRLEEWDDVLWRTMGGLRTAPLGTRAFAGRASFATAGPIRLCGLHSSPAHVVRDRARGPVEDRDFLKIAIQLRGQTRFEQGSREILLDGAGWTLYDTSRPYTVANLTDVQQLVLLVPKSDLAVPSRDIAHCSVMPMGVAGGISRMLPGYVTSLLAEKASMSAADRFDLGEMMLQLLRLSIRDQSRAVAPVTAQETLAFQIKHYIRNHLADPALSVQHLADRFDCTKRHLHRAFGTESLTLADYILSARIDHAAHLLSTDTHRAHSISEIALMSGFNNFSHFSRVFKAHIGVTPRAYRSENAAGRFPETH